MIVAAVGITVIVEAYSERTRRYTSREEDHLVVRRTENRCWCFDWMLISVLVIAPRSLLKNDNREEQAPREKDGGSTIDPTLPMASDLVSERISVPLL